MAKMQTCSSCSGYGQVSDYSGGDFNVAMECSECDGTGKVRPRDKNGRFLKIDEPEICPDCSGGGYFLDKTQLGPEFFGANQITHRYCETCSGFGVVG